MAAVASPTATTPLPTVPRHSKLYTCDLPLEECFKALVAGGSFMGFTEACACRTAGHAPFPTNHGLAVAGRCSRL
jgi:hypothetical protein